MREQILEKLEAIERRLSAPARAFLTTKEAARFLGLSYKQVELWRTQGGGPAYHRVGRRVLYSVEDLRAFMAPLRREPLQ